MKILLIFLVALTAFVVSAEMKVQRTGSHPATGKSTSSRGHQAPGLIDGIISRGKEALGGLTRTVKGESKPAPRTAKRDEAADEPESTQRTAANPDAGDDDQAGVLKESLWALAEDARKLNPRLITNLAEDLSKVLADGSLSKKRMATLTNHMEKVINAGSVSKSEVTAAIAEAKSLLVAAGLATADAQLIADDLRAIDSDTRHHAPKTAAAAGDDAPKKTTTKPVARQTTHKTTTRRPAHPTATSQVAMRIER